MWDSPELRQRFNAKFSVGNPDDCWLWLGSTNPKGYGLFRAPPEQLAHRVAYRLEREEIPIGMSICHVCDNPPCVNPTHLFIGTHADNMADMAAKGRSGVRPRLPRHLNARARFSEKDVEDMVLRYVSGETQASIAKTYETCQGVIGKIVRARCNVNSRFRRARGLSSANGKLSDEDAIEIRRLYRSGLSQESIGRAFGVSQASVSAIIRRVTFAYLPENE